MSKKINVDLTPHTSLFTKLGKTGYTVYEAFGEPVDNAIDARFPDKTLNIQIRIDKNSIVISDNGIGMDKESAINAMKIAFSKKNKAIGQNGLGLKTATSRLGGAFTIETTSKGVSEKYIIHYDEVEWTKKDNWKEHPMLVEKVPIEEHGTKITITKLKIGFYANLVTELKKYFSLRYSPYIRNGEVKIKVNRKYCEPYEEELTSDGKTSLEIELSNGTKVTGWVGLRKDKTYKDNYGFSCYLRGRLVEHNQKIGFLPHPELSQLIGELNMDDIPINLNKTMFMKDSDVFREMVKKLQITLKPFMSKARKARYPRKRTHKERYPRLEKFLATLKERPDLERYIHRLHHSGPLLLNHHFASRGADAPSSELNERVHDLTIITNKDSPAYKFTTDEEFFAALQVAEALAKRYVEQNKLSIQDYREVRDEILSKTLMALLSGEEK